MIGDDNPYQRVHFQPNCTLPQGGIWRRRDLELDKVGNSLTTHSATGRTHSFCCSANAVTDAFQPYFPIQHEAAASCVACYESLYYPYNSTNSNSKLPSSLTFERSHANFVNFVGFRRMSVRYRAYNPTISERPVSSFKFPNNLKALTAHRIFSPVVQELLQKRVHNVCTAANCQPVREIAHKLRGRSGIQRFQFLPLLSFSRKDSYAVEDNVKFTTLQFEFDRLRTQCKRVRNVSSISAAPAGWRCCDGWHCCAVASAESTLCCDFLQMELFYRIKN